MRRGRSSCDVSERPIVAKFRRFPRRPCKKTTGGSEEEDAEVSAEKSEYASSTTSAVAAEKGDGEGEDSRSVLLPNVRLLARLIIGGDCAFRKASTPRGDTERAAVATAHVHAVLKALRQSMLCDDKLLRGRLLPILILSVAVALVDMMAIKEGLLSKERACGVLYRIAALLSR